MNIGSETSNPIPFGQGQTSDDLALFRELAIGEVMAAFHAANLTLETITARSIDGTNMKSARFPRTWKATAGYHQRGQELLGDNIETGEIIVTPDQLLTSSNGIYDVDDLLSHFDVRGPFMAELGKALAQVLDENNFRQIVLAARKSNDGPFPGGHVISDAALAADANGKYDGLAWYEAIRLANQKLYEADVPEDLERYMAVDWYVFEALKHAKDSNGNFLVLNKNTQGIPGGGGIAKRDETLELDGVTIHKTKRIPKNDDSANQAVYNKYRANFTNTKAALWTPQSIVNVTTRDVRFETFRDVRRQEDFMVASTMVGADTMRAETTVEFTI